MQHTYRVTLSFVALCLMFLTVPLAFAADWNATQKEVWKNVEAYWAAQAAGDLEGFLSYFHSDYLGWTYNSSLPEDKASVRKWIAYEMKSSKVQVYEVKPVAIQVYGNVAFVHYFFAQALKDAEGKEKSVQGRWTDILMKQGDKWVMIGDHGGRTSKE